MAKRLAKVVVGLQKSFPPAKTDKLEDFNSPSRSTWQIPDGVSHGTWDYVRTRSIATEYGNFLHADPLTRLDWQIVCRWLPKIPPGTASPTVGEFGCGNGRTLIPLIKRGYRCVGVDLSIAMLQEMEKNFQHICNGNATGNGDCDAAGIDRERLISMQANLVHLDGLQSQSLDHAVCLFSTLGMIRGQQFRRQFLNHARRIIKPGGYFILHAHHVWSQIRDRGGVKWFAGHLADVVRGRNEFGDRFAEYRGIRNMFIHSFRKSELIGLLEAGGFSVEEIYPVTRALLDQIRSCDNDREFTAADNTQIINNAITQAAPAGALKTIGWIVVCQ